jgi:hypothetical protein
MKRIIMLALVLVVMLVSIGGCWVGWYEDGRRGGGGGHDRGGGRETHQSHEERR